MERLDQEARAGALELAHGQAKILPGIFCHGGAAASGR